MHLHIILVWLLLKDEETDFRLGALCCSGIGMSLEKYLLYCVN